MPYTLDDIKGKVCAITGGGGVIGTSFALGLAEAGAKVAILDFKKENADAVAQKVNEKFPGNAISVFANVLEKNTLIDAKKEISEKFGKLDVLINGAGGNAPTATTQLEYLSTENLGELSKGFFNDLAAWEEDHYRAIYREIQFLEDEYYQKNNFSPF